jgi:hypothetical protein
MNAGKPKYVLIRGIDRDLHAAARVAAFREGVSFQGWIMRAMAERLAKTAAAPTPAPTPTADPSA